MATKWRNVAFRFEKVRFQHDRRFASMREGFRTTTLLLECTVTPMIFAIAAIVACLGLSHGQPSIMERLGWGAIGMIGNASGSYASFMGTVAQSSAAMLALFFTAVSVVASTAYAKAHNDIRSLVLQDVPNTRYLKLVAHTAATSIGALFLDGIGVSASAPLAAYIIIIATITVLAFFPLAVRTFSLFDPDNLVVYPMTDFSRALESVCAPNRRHASEPFQRHANAQAEHHLRILLEILTFKVADEPFPHASILGIGTKVCDLARYYAGRKLAIPSDSLWFSRKVAFKPWSAIDSTTADIARNSGTLPMQEQVPNYQYVEERCVIILRLALRSLLRQGKIEEATRLLFAISQTIIALAHARQFDEAALMGTMVREIFLELSIAEMKPAKGDLFQIADLTVVASIDLVLHPGRALDRNAAANFDQVVTAMLRGDLAVIYTMPGTRATRRHLEDLVQRLRFEQAVEGSVRSSPWFLRHVLAQIYAEEIRDAARVIVENLQAFSVVGEKLTANGHHEVATMWWLRAIEACHKAHRELQALCAHHDELKVETRSGDRWPDSGIDALIESVRVTKRKIIELLAGLVGKLSLQKSDDGIPDLLGNARVQLGAELIAMMSEKQADNFAVCFHAYFIASIAIRDAFVKTGKPAEVRRANQLVTDVSLDLQELSGIALIYAELDGTSFGSLVRAEWDAFLSLSPDSKRVIGIVFADLVAGNRAPLMTAGSTQRFAWTRHLQDDLENRGIKTERLGFSYHDDVDRVPHKNPVIESFSVAVLDERKPRWYFAALYLAARPEIHGEAIPEGVQECLRAIRFATERIDRHKANGDSSSQQVQDDA